jgi:hypothetical protein
LQRLMREHRLLQPKRSEGRRGVVAVASLLALMRYRRSAWNRAAATPLTADDDET